LHLSGSLLVFRRKMSPVRRKEKNKKKRTYCGWKSYNNMKTDKEFEERSQEESRGLCTK